MKKEKKKTTFKIIWPQFILRLFLFFLFLFSIWAIYFLFKIKSFEKSSLEIDISQKTSLLSTVQQIVAKDKKALKGADKKRINILLLGMGGEGHSGQFLTDTIILASINPETYQTALLAIPRDLYVEVPKTFINTKINAVYAYGRKKQKENSTELIEKTVEKITGQEIDYYLNINFEGFKKVIDELGGIIVQVEEDIVDHKYPGPGRSYETFKIDKGTHLINGDVTLKYARVRHVKGGDFSRLERQKDIIVAAKKRAFSIENFANPMKLTNLLTILEDNLQTNIRLDEIPAFIELAKNINPYQINSKVLDAWSHDSLLAVSHVFLGGLRAFILVPRTGNYQEIKSLSENIFELSKTKKENDEIAKESAQITLITKNYQNPSRIKTIFEKMNYEIDLEEDKELTEKCQSEIKIMTKATDKFYTLNDLSNKFNADILEDINFDYSSDLVLCFPENEIEKLEKQINQTDVDQFQGGLILDNDGNILYNEK